jgi:cytochrome c553
VRFPIQAYADAVTRFGRSGNREFDIPMPAYPVEKISDQQLREMWTYLSSFPRPTTGKELFNAYCANCHGQDGRGGFSGEGILGETGEYRKYIRRGKNLRYPLNRRKYMPAYGEMELSANDILLLRQYARELRQTAQRPSPYPQPTPHDDEDDEDEDDD